jgi:hypothetical protein
VRYRLTGAGLSPAGSRQLRLTHRNRKFESISLLRGVSNEPCGCGEFLWNERLSRTLPLESAGGARTDLPRDVCDSRSVDDRSFAIRCRRDARFSGLQVKAACGCDYRGRRSCPGARQSPWSPITVEAWALIFKNIAN